MDHPEQPGPGQPSEDRLRGDSSLLDDQLRQLLGRLRLFCSRLVGSRTDLGITADDLLQEVLVSILWLRCRRSEALPTLVSRYFKAAAENKLRDALRRARGRGRTSHPISVDLSQAGGHLASSRFEDPGYRITMADEVDWALSWLERNGSPREIMIFRSYLIGEAIEDIAWREGVSLSGVEKTISRVRARLRAAANRRR